MSLANPYLAVRNISMAMASTDFNSYTDFQEKAENYRRYLVKQMNADYRDHSKTGEFYEYKADHNLWESIKDFGYEVPSLRTANKTLVLEFAGLMVWVVVSVVMVNTTTKRNEI